MRQCWQTGCGSGRAGQTRLTESGQRQVRKGQRPSRAWQSGDCRGHVDASRQSGAVAGPPAVADGVERHEAFCCIPGRWRQGHRRRRTGRWGQPIARTAAAAGKRRGDRQFHGAVGSIRSLNPGTRSRTRFRAESGKGGGGSRTTGPLRQRRSVRARGPGATRRFAAARLASGLGQGLAAVPIRGAAGSGQTVFLCQPRGSRQPAELPRPGNSVAVPTHVLKIELHPAELGAVTASLRLSGEQLSIEMKPETHEAYRRLTTDSDAIIKSMRSLGFDVDKVTILQPSIAAHAASRADSNSAMPMSTGRDQPSFQPGNSGGNNAGGGRQPGRNEGNGAQEFGRVASPLRERAGDDIYI
ncbi:MAG: flagellar hook-length control protein FliK [Mesorhizobium sp.]|nr:flagellar hook-length control protein FliK [Mesorhizobium sp.]